jgi:hypothetical protein
MLDKNFTIMQRDIEVIPITRSKTPAQLLSFRLHAYSLLKVSPSLKTTSTRRKSGHCLGTFKTGDLKKQKCFLPPSP